MRLLLLFLTVACVSALDGFFSPIASFESVFDVGGTLYRNRTAIIQCSESVRGGKLRIGVEEMDISCQPPRRFYTYTAVGRIPKLAQLQVQEECLVESITRFNQSREAAVQRMVASNTAGRRLLCVEFVALGLAIEALSNSIEAKKDAKEALEKSTQAINIASKAQISASEANQKSNINTQHILDLQVKLGDVAVWQQQVDAANLAFATTVSNQAALSANISQHFDYEIGTLNNQLSGTQQQIGLLAQNQNSTDQAIKLLRASASQEFDAMKQELLATQQSISTMSGAADAQIKAVFSDLVTRIVNLTTRVQQDNDDIFSRLADLRDQNVVDRSNFKAWQKQTQLRHSMSVGHHKMRNALPSYLIPWVTDDGIAPLNNGILTGVYNRILLERIDVNYVTTTQGGSYKIANRQIRVYQESYHAVQFSSDNLMFEDMIKWIGPSGCKRPVGETDPSLANAPLCRIWMEVTETQCTSAYTTPRYDWVKNKTTTNVEARDCDPTGSSGAVVTTTDLVLRSLDAFQTYISSLCSLAVTPARFRLSTFRTSTVYNIPAPVSVSACSYNLRQMEVLARQTNVTNLFPYVLRMIEYGYEQAAEDRATRELMMFGRLPGGITYDEVPFVYTPTTQNSSDPNSAPIIDGGADAHKCYYATWMAMHTDTVQVYALQPNAGNIISKQINIDRFSGPSSIGRDIYHDNIILLDDASNLLPGNLLAVGDINQASTNGIYDVPDTLLDISSNPKARANKVTYPLQSNDIVQTQSFSDFNSKNEQRYDTKDATVSAHMYRFDAAEDFEGYPVCNVPGGVPSTEQMLGVNGFKINQCANGASWSNVTNAQTYSCTNTTNSLLTTTNTTLFTPLSTSSFSVSFWYTNHGDPATPERVSVLRLTSTTSTTLEYVVVAGRPQLFINHTAVSNTIPDPTYKLESIKGDGLPHQLTWTWTTGASDATVRLYLDGALKLKQVLNGASYAALVWNRYLTSSQLNQTLANLIQIQQVRYYPHISNSALNWLQIHHCERAFLDKSCQVTNRTNAVQGSVILARQVITSTSYASCSTVGQLLYADAATRLQYPGSFDPLTNSPGSSYSVSFWLSTNINTGTSSIEYLRLMTSAWTLSVSVSNTASARMTATLCGFGCSSAMLTDVAGIPDIVSGVAHFYTVTYQSSGDTLKLYMDGLLVASKTTTTRTSFTSTPSVIVANSTVDAIGAVTMVKLYPSTILNAIAVVAEYQCQVGTGAIAPFQPPVGFCQFVTTNISSLNNAYCRHPMMCNGHCAALSTVQPSTGIFTPSKYVCDDGWAAPDCTTRCVRSDVVTGQCLDVLDASEIARTTEVANGQWCTLLKFYKVYTILQGSPPRRMLVLEPRRWLYQASVTVPFGEIVSVVGNGGCPISTFERSPDGAGVVLVMKNEGMSDSNVLVRFGSPEFINGTATEACLLPCCNTDGQAAVVPARGVLSSIRVSNCGSITMQVFLNSPVLGPTDLCSDRSFESITSEIGTADTEPAFVVTSYVNTQIDQVLEQNAQSDLNRQALLILLLAQGVSSNFQSQAFLNALEAQKQSILNGSIISVNFNSTYLTKPTVLAPTSFDVLLQANANRTQELAVLATQQTVLQTSFTTSQQATAGLLAQQQTGVEALKENVKAFQAIYDNPFNWTFANITAEIERIETEANAQRAALDTALQQMQGFYLPSSSSSSDTLAIVAIVFGVLNIVAVGGVCWFLYIQNRKKLPEAAGLVETFVQEKQKNIKSFTE